METQKIVNSLNDSNNENLKFATKKWYVINDESKGSYSPRNEVKFLTSSLESNLCDYSDPYILVTGNTVVTGGNANAKVAFKNCALFKNCRTETNDTFVDNAANTNIAMPTYNLTEYSDNFSDSSVSLWQFNRDELNNNDINTILALINTIIPLHLSTKPVLLVILVQMEEKMV